MEHRWSQRSNCNVPVLIRYREVFRIRCTVIDIGKAGLGLDTGPIHLSPGAVVELQVDSSRDGVARHPLLALVIHSSNGRAGLWLGDDPEQYERLTAFTEPCE